MNSSRVFQIMSLEDKVAILREYELMLPNIKKYLQVLHPEMIENVIEKQEELMEQYNHALQEAQTMMSEENLSNISKCEVEKIHFLENVMIEWYKRSYRKGKPISISALIEKTKSAMIALQIEFVPTTDKWFLNLQRRCMKAALVKDKSSKSTSKDVMLIAREILETNGSSKEDAFAKYGIEIFVVKTEENSNELSQYHHNELAFLEEVIIEWYRRANRVNGRWKIKKIYFSIFEEKVKAAQALFNIKTIPSPDSWIVALHTRCRESLIKNRITACSLNLNLKDIARDVLQKIGCSKELALTKYCIAITGNAKDQTLHLPIADSNPSLTKKFNIIQQYDQLTDTGDQMSLILNCDYIGEIMKNREKIIEEYNAIHQNLEDATLTELANKKKENHTSEKVALFYKVLTEWFKRANMKAGRKCVPLGIIRVHVILALCVLNIEGYKSKDYWIHKIRKNCMDSKHIWGHDESYKSMSLDMLDIVLCVLKREGVSKEDALRIYEVEMSEDNEIPCKIPRLANQIDVSVDVSRTEEPTTSKTTEIEGFQVIDSESEDDNSSTISCIKIELSDSEIEDDSEYSFYLMKEIKSDNADEDTEEEGVIFDEDTFIATIIKHEGNPIDALSKLMKVKEEYNETANENLKPPTSTLWEFQPEDIKQETHTSTCILQEDIKQEPHTPTSILQEDVKQEPHTSTCILHGDINQEHHTLSSILQEDTKQEPDTSTCILQEDLKQELQDIKQKPHTSTPILQEFIPFDAIEIKREDISTSSEEEPVLIKTEVTEPEELYAGTHPEVENLKHNSSFQINDNHEAMQQINALKEFLQLQRDSQALKCTKRIEAAFIEHNEKNLGLEIN